MIKPKSRQSSTRTKADLMRSVDPAASGLDLVGVKHISGGGVMVSCSSGEGADKLRGLAGSALSDDYVVRDAAKLHPRLRVVGMTELYDKDRVASLIKAQNSDIFGDSDFSIISMGSLKNDEKVYQVTLQVDVLTYRRAMSRLQVFIGFDVCRVYDGINVIRCFNCCGYHHVSVGCKNKLVCPRCAGEHTVKDCRSTSLKCINCLNISKVLPDIATNHAAWDHDCTVYKKKLASLHKDLLGQ